VPELIQIKPKELNAKPDFIKGVVNMDSNSYTLKDWNESKNGSVTAYYRCSLLSF